MKKKELSFIAIIFISLVFFLDLIFMKILGNKFSYKSICYDEITIYNYCKNSVQINYLDEKEIDKKLIKTYIDENRIPYIKGGDKILPSKANILIIGDSFIQADEIETSKRITEQFNRSNLSAISLGFSSWSPFQYNRLLKKNIYKKNENFLIFLMTNDFLPNYKYSTINFSEKETEYKKIFINKEKFEKTLFYKIKQFLKGNSFIFSSISKIKKNLFNQDAASRDYLKITDNFNIDNLNDCSLINKYENKISNLILDYIYFSKSEKCWSQKHKKSVDHAVNLINGINNFILPTQKVYFILIPPGWSIRDENLEGKTFGNYKIDKSVTITHTGLSNYLEKKLTNFYDLEPVLVKLKEKYPESNSLYFSRDGHWTELTHSSIFKWLKEIL